jgi:hypothetical protein
MMPLPLSVIDVVLLVEIIRLYFYIIFSNLCADIVIKSSVSAVITWSSAKRMFSSLFLVFCIPFIFYVFHCESILFIYDMFNAVGEGDQL